MNITEPDATSEAVADLDSLHLHTDTNTNTNHSNIDTTEDTDAVDAHNEGSTSKLEQQQVQDALLLQTVLLATKYVIKDKQLPMLVSTYWTILQRYV